MVCMMYINVLCIFTDHIERYADGNYMVFIWENLGVSMSNQFDSYLSIPLDMVPVNLWLNGKHGEQWYHSL